MRCFYNDVCDRKIYEITNEGQQMHHATVQSLRSSVCKSGEGHLSQHRPIDYGNQQVHRRDEREKDVVRGQPSLFLLDLSVH